MSEFSHSYHWEGDSQDAGVDLLQRAGMRGFVFPPANGWVTLVPSLRPYGEANEDLIRVTQGVLVHYVNAEDAGWDIEVYQEGLAASRYECSWLELHPWNDELKWQDSELDIELLARIAARHGANREQAVAELELLLHPPSLEWLGEFFEMNDGQNPGHAVAKLLGLTNYSWIGAKYLGPATTFGELGPVEVAVFDRHPGICEVSPTGVSYG